MESCWITDFGAIGDGTMLCGEPIQEAIDICHKNGGGYVDVPRGVYRSGSIELKSGVFLRLHAGARLCSCEEPGLYPRMEASQKTSIEKKYITAFIRADGANNIGIVGDGNIDGGYRNDAKSGFEFRPGLVYFRECRDVTIRDVSFIGANFWTVHLFHCDNVMVRGVTIDNNRERINTDGIDPDGCRNVVISDCNLRCGDDCICLKTTSGRVCEHIVVSNCICTTFCAAIKIGTESTADIRAVTMQNCIIHDSTVAIALYMKDGATYEEMMFSGIRIESGGPYPILIDSASRYYEEAVYGMIRDIVFDNMIIRGAGRIRVDAPATHPVQNLRINNISWKITEALQEEIPARPRGSVTISVDPAELDYGQKRAQITLTGVRESSIRNCSFIDARSDSTSADSRIVLFAADTSGLSMDNVRWYGRMLEPLDPDNSATGNDSEGLRIE